MKIEQKYRKDLKTIPSWILVILMVFFLFGIAFVLPDPTTLVIPSYLLVSILILMETLAIILTMVLIPRLLMKKMPKTVENIGEEIIITFTEGVSTSDVYKHILLLYNGNKGSKYSYDWENNVLKIYNCFTREEKRKHNDS